jgi:hypothetical protein
MKIALVCIAKNEDNYIEEWLDYYTKLGVDDIFVYQNDWRTNVERENLHKFVLDGINKQREAYNSFISDYKNQYDWVLFYDIDEFLVLKKHNNIKEFISDYSEHNGIGVNWVLFGGNNQTYVPGGETSLLKRFTMRQKSINQHIKSIVKLSNNFTMDIHSPSLPLVDTNHNIFWGPFNSDGDDNVAQINHYWCKTREEYVEKMNRGRADAADPIHNNKPEYYDAYDINEIEDTIARDFLYV